MTCPSDSRAGVVLALFLLFALPALPGVADGLAAQDGASLIVLVRHAERAGPSAEDPGLTELGSERALALARLLIDSGITAIHSTDTQRTRDTGAPLAKRLGLSIELYDGRDLEAVAEHLLALPGRHLVVGHSNTTDELSALLGGEAFGEIIEAWEYDRLYLLTPRPEGGMETVLLRYGPEVVGAPEGAKDDSIHMSSAPGEISELLDRSSLAILERGLRIRGTKPPDDLFRVQGSVLRVSDGGADQGWAIPRPPAAPRPG